MCWFRLNQFGHVSEGVEEIVLKYMVKLFLECALFVSYVEVGSLVVVREVEVAADEDRDGELLRKQLADGTPNFPSFHQKAIEEKSGY